MGKVLIIGAGGVGTVVAQRMARMPEIFEDIMLASRTKSKCDHIVRSVTGSRIKTAQVDAADIPQLVELIQSFKPDLVVNVALPYQDIAIMEACLETEVSYLDTANYEPKDDAKFEYKWQWAYQNRFKEAGLTAILGCGFDPGVTNVFTAYAAKHHFDEINYLDIVDCDTGENKHLFAANYNPESIREVTQNGRYWEDGQWIETPPLELHKPLNYPGIGTCESHLIYHEELESLVKNFPTLKCARFWMTFNDAYITHLRVAKNIGMAGSNPVRYEGRKIVPIHFLKAVLPGSGEAPKDYKGEIAVGCRIKGITEGKEKTLYIYNNCSYKTAGKESGVQAVSYTTGIPAMIGAMLYLKGKWKKPGVFNVEEFDPDPFMEQLNKQGLPWHELHDVELEV